MIKIVELLEDYNIEHTENHHHCTPGWVNIHCPFCAGSQNFHLGIHKQSGACHCWRCGGHSLIDTLSTVLSISKGKTAQIIKNYSEIDYTVHVKELQKPDFNKDVILPKDLKPLTQRHKDYLKSRGFDPGYLSRYFGLQSIGLDATYGYRIFIPIIYNGKLVSFTSRTINPDKKPRYLTCAKANEVIHHKYILYNLDNIPSKDSILVVEGPADVWRMGMAVATFGITYTLPQVMLLSQFKNVFIMYDDEPVAYNQAKRLSYEIQLLGNNNVYILSDYSGDPGDLDKKHIEEVKSLIASAV